MPSTSETGHSKNAANFEDLISFCTGYGANYNPSKASIKLPALLTLKSDADTVLTTVTKANTIFMDATNARQIIFDPIKKLATRIVNALATTDASKEKLDNAKTINRKIQGARKGNIDTPTTPPVDPTPPNPVDPVVTNDKHISVSQQSYDSLIDNFKKLIELISGEPSYAPNEIELQVATLVTLVQDMATKNSAVINAFTTLSNARIARDKVLYLPQTGLYDIAQEVKKYVKSVFGATSPEYKQVSGIKFTHIIK